MSESKGNPTGSNLLTDASLQPRPVFTTAGTVWNPESAKPMRAPVRRGRASATPLGSPLGDQWTFLSQHDGGGLFHPGQAPPVLPHYSPLQQNNDRAVSPSPPLSDHGGNPPSSNMASIEAGVGRSPIQPGGAAMTPHGSQSDKASLELHGDEDDDVPDDNDYGFARMLPIKSLVNLASYKNPVQQKAQNLLRGNSNSGLLLGGTSAMLDNSSEAPAPSAPRNVQSLAAAPRSVPAQHAHVGVRPLVDSSAMPPKLPISTQPAHTRQRSLFPSSTLATGPGSPEPLKAGPPGQRPQGPSRIESTLAASLHGPGVSTMVQPANGVHSTQPHRQYPPLFIPKNTGGSAMAGPPRPMPVGHYGHDGARSSKEHTDATSEVAALRNIDFSAHPGFRAATRASTGEGSVSEASSRVATPPGFNRQNHGRSQGNSSQSARSGSGGVSVHQPSGHNAIPDQRVHTALPLPGQRTGPSDQALSTVQPTIIDPLRHDMASTTETYRAQFIGAHPSQMSNNGGQAFPSHWGNENLASNICRVGSANALYDGVGIMSRPDGGHKQIGSIMQVPIGPQTMLDLGGAGHWSQNVEQLEPVGWDPAEYHMPYSGQYPYGAMKMDAQMLRENDAKIDAWFYSNTSRLGKTMDEVLDERRHPKARPSPFGSIGDGRPAPKPGQKKTYSQISIEGANEMPTSEHAEPLLSLAFQAILDFKDAEAARACPLTSDRMTGEDGIGEDAYDKLGSAALFPGSFSDSD